MLFSELLSVREGLKAHLRLLDETILGHLKTWQSKALHGFTIEAIKQYREENKCDLRVAKDSVDSFVYSQCEIDHLRR